MDSFRQVFIGTIYDHVYKEREQEHDGLFIISEDSQVSELDMKL